MNKKDIKIIILIPFEATILYHSAMAIIDLFIYLKREEIDYQFYSISGSAHAFARNLLFKKAHEHLQTESFTHILLLDSDHIFKPEDVMRLLWLKEEFKSDILGAGYLTKTEPVNLVALKAITYSENDETLPIRYTMLTHFELDKVYEVDGVGFGMVVMGTNVLEKMIEHYKTTELCEFPYKEGIVIGEDISFCQKAKAIGFKVEVTTAVMIGHVCSAIMTMDYAEKLYKRDFSVSSILAKQEDKNEVEGWLLEEEGNLLEKLAKDNKNGNIVEIGSWKGRSTIRLAKGTIAGKKNIIFAIDPHTGSPEHIDALGEQINTYPEFEQNIKNAGVENYIVPVVQTSEEAALTFNAPIGLIFIDGDHTYEMVKKDFEMWNSKVLPGGIIAFHDNHWPGVLKVLKDIEYDPKYRIRNKKIECSITYFEKY